MKRNQSIELLKLISCFFIVIIHNPFTSSFGFAMDAIARFSVPFFFMTTGYFIVEPNNPSSNLKKQIIKLIKYYFIYEFIYILSYFIIALVKNDSTNLLNALIRNLKHIWIEPTIGAHLWYVINIIWVLVIIYFFNWWGKLKLLFIGSIALHFVGIFISHLSLQLFHHVLPLYMTRNFLFLGLFYVLLGSYIRKIDINKIKINNSIILALAIIMCILQISERYAWTILFNSTFKEYYITTIIASTLIFIFALRATINNKIIEKISSYSMSIYFLHMLIMNILDLLNSHIPNMNINILKSSIIGNFIYIVFVCLLSCFFYDILKKTHSLLLSNS